MAKKFVLSKASKRMLQQRVRTLTREIWRLQEKLWSSIASPTIDYTLERDMRAGQTIQVHFPRKFVVRD